VIDEGRNESQQVVIADNAKIIVTQRFSEQRMSISKPTTDTAPEFQLE